MSFALFVFLAFLAGSLPFSLWIGQLILGKDIRTVGDANPGATNVLRAGGKGSAALALLLDFFKGSIPVGIAHLWLHWSDWALIFVALAPVLGHAFSPVLGGRGGKAVAVTGGIWCGLTIWEGPLVFTYTPKLEPPGCQTAALARHELHLAGQCTHSLVEASR
jgi:glycerol-3-phosphate acyltransferase PlsY